LPSQTKVGETHTFDVNLNKTVEWVSKIGWGGKKSQGLKGTFEEDILRSQTEILLSSVGPLGQTASVPLNLKNWGEKKNGKGGCVVWKRSGGLRKERGVKLSV